MPEVELLAGTRKGLFVLRGPRDGALHIAHRCFAGQDVPYAMRDPRTGSYFASVVHGQFGPHVFRTADLSAEWQETEGLVFPEGSNTTLERVWTVVPGAADGVLYAGVAPAALFESHDGGTTWTLNAGLWQAPGRAGWQPGFGGLALHSICPWPGDPSRLAIGISAAGVWTSGDAGATWRRTSTGLVARYLPEEAQAEATDHCVHAMKRAPTQPATLYLQFHGGVYRSDDAGETWRDIAGTGSDTGLPADFGFPIAVDPRDPDRAWVIPLNSDQDRVSAGGALRVFETADRGRSWHPRTEGLPGPPAYLTILRQAFCHDGADPLGLYFGTTGGEIFASADGAQHWHSAARHLPPVLSLCSA